MKVACIGYRDWALNIFRNIGYEFVAEDKADVVLYYGWSDMIPKEIYENKICLILHPSPLPKYRGGSPLQHQIMAGEKVSAVTICRVTDRLDAGDIYSQTPFSLEGKLSDVFKKITEIGIKDTIKVLKEIEDGTINPTPQKEDGTYYKRRKPEESEIYIEDFKNKTAEEMYNFIRALADPYPNAFIICKDGKKVYFTGARLESQEE